MARHRENGVGRVGGQAVLTRFQSIPENPVKVTLKSVKIWSKSLEIVCFQRYKTYPDRAEKAKSGQVRPWDLGSFRVWCIYEGLAKKIKAPFPRLFLQF